MTMPSHLPSHCWDALIVGGGPAGTAAAIALARNGWQVLIAEKQSAPGIKFGESLPPAAVDLVEQLVGPVNDINPAKHGIFKTAGNISCWQSPKPDTSDFFHTPKGFGLCIDRIKFDTALIASAKASGARFLSSAQFIQCRRCDNNEQGNWAVEIQSNGGREWHYANYLIDSSGRRAVVANALGVVRQRLDRLFAYSQHFAAGYRQDDDRFTQLEANAQGWWYSNRLPPTANEQFVKQKAKSGLEKSERIVVFHTDRDLACAKQAATTAGFARLMSESHHIAALLKKHNYQPTGKIRGASAASERLGRFSGDAWMAVGDAAQAYDPLSSQGITKALTSGTMAGQLLHYALTSLAGESKRRADPALFKRYNAEQERLWNFYLQQHQYYYGNQPRWRDQLFWHRRSSNEAVDAISTHSREVQ